ncbi:MAG: biotin synthase BioB [Candidatus Margulisiibacteriota bacterium]
MYDAELYKLQDRSLSELMRLADTIRAEKSGSNIDLCTITNAKSGACSEDCRFCAQSSHYSTDIASYPLKSMKTMVEEARTAKGYGAHRFCIVTSGNSLSPEELALISGTVTKIISDVGMIMDASLGALSLDDLLLLKLAGLTRYHHNIETSRDFYPKIVSTHSFDQRVNTIKSAKKAGLEVCSGGIIGLGESWKDRIDMALLLKELDVDSIPINILNPIKGTPLQGADNISVEDAMKTIAIFRIILPGKVIKVAAGRETKFKGHQQDIFRAGANGMLIGGYLTTKGRPVEEDRALVEEMEEMWGKEE